jgi:hypothetical protein
VLENLHDAVEVAAIDGRTPRPTMIVGARGVGKTVLLAQAAAIAGSEFGWPRVHTELRPDTPFIPDLIDAIGRVRNLVAGSAEDPTPALRPALTELAELAIARETGFVLTLDEAHLATRRELAALAALLQEGTGERWPVVVVIAGLPLMRAPEHSVTYLERGTWHELGLLSDEETVRALSLPAEAAGRPMDEDAAIVLADASGGYPYAIQLYGHHAWRASSGHDRIDLAAAQAALPRAQQELESGLYAARWSAASPTQKRYLTALATIAATTTTPMTGRAVAEQLGRTPKQLSSVRDDLIKAGTLTVDDKELRFTIPGMGAYIRTH